MGTLLAVVFTWYITKVWYTRTDINKPEGLYLRRLILFRAKAGGRLDWLLSLLGIRIRRIFLHRIYLPDSDRDMHNHPWTYCGSFILRGGYREILSNGPSKWHFAGKVHRISADIYHKITHVLPNTWTLFFAGYRDREWGFRVPIEYCDPVTGEQTYDWMHIDWHPYLGVPEGTELDD